MPTDGSWIPGAIAGGAAALIVDWLKRMAFVPRLIPQCEAKRKGFTPIARVPGRFTSEGGPEVNARYVRVAVTNRSLTRTSAKACKAYLTAIRVINATGSFDETSFAESLRLRWAYEGPNGELHGGIEIPTGVTVYFDVFSSQEPTPWNEKVDGDERILEVAAKDARQAPEFVNLLALNSAYRFSLLITADGIEPVKAELDVRLGSSWNQIEIDHLHLVTA